MRLTATVVSPAAGIRVDVTADMDPQTPVGEVARDLAGFVQGGQYRDGVQDPGSWDGDDSGPGGGPGEAISRNVVRLPTRSAAPAAESAGRGRSAAALAPRRQAGPALYLDGRRIPDDLPVAESPLRTGCVISLGDPAGCLPPEPSGVVEVRVVGGESAGAVHRLGVGAAQLGSAPEAAVPLPGRGIAARAASLTVDARGTCLLSAANGAANGAGNGAGDGAAVTLDGKPVTQPVAWSPGQQASIGGTLLELALYEPPDAALRPSEDGGGLDFNRPPRLLPPVRETRFTLPTPPSRGERRPLPVMMAVIPVVMGVGLTLLLHEVYMLAMCAMSPATLIGNYFSDRKHGRKSYAARMASYREHRARIEQDARQALDAERTARRADCPDAASVLSIATGPRRRLWERRRSDPDFLLLRVGIADLPSAVELRDPTLDEHRQQVVWEVPRAPVTMPLRGRGVVGVAGPGDSPRAIGRWLVAQIATLHSPNDVRICLLTDSSGQDSWEWARWLPHCQHPAGTTAALIGNDAETVAVRIAELLAVIKDRQKALEARSQPAGFREPDFVVVFDGSRRLRSLPGAIQLLREGPAVGVHAICLDAEERLLPAECHAVAAVTPGGLLRVQQMSADVVGAAQPDHVTPGWCLRLSRSLAPIRDISDDEEGLGLPESSRLLDVLNLEPPTRAAIASRWAAGGRSTLAVLGDSYDGPFGIDLRRDGPHGLVAGTTGAGKSELLQTIVASLAVANRPDAMTFVLIDYKGGSAFKDCVSLPHTVGMVTDLDAHLVGRALESLSAELTRREHMLAGVGAKDIEDYTSLADAGRRLDRLPRLLIVIDEFASMARDLPDFVTGLVNIAQRGRSLGIHLILATQRPSGVVSPEIRANTNLRIALRVTDPAESIDIIDAPDAARIAKSTPGRAYVRLGHSSLVPFQAGRVGGRRRGAASAVLQRPWLARIQWSDAGQPAAQRPPGRSQEAQQETDLKALVEAISEATKRLGIPAQHSPWLPPLPETLLLSDLTDSEPGHGGQPAAVLAPAPYGITDLPAQQARQLAAIDFAAFGHLMAAGGPRSGRSQLLRTIAGSIAAANSCADVHLYGIDCGNGALLPAGDLPHCGAVVLRTQPERATRLLGRLAGELSHRQELLAGGGFADIGEQRAAAGAGPGLPHIVILLDRWEGFTTTLGELDNGRLTDVITRILGEGGSAGMHLVITGDRSLIAGRISSLTEDKLVFKLPDRDDVNLVGLRPRDLPDDIPAGRAFRAGSGQEMQVALLAPDSSGPGQAVALREIAARASRRDAGVARPQRPFRVDVLPARLAFADAWRLRDTGVAARPLWGLVGVGGDDLAAYGPDLSDGLPAFIVGGPAKSGRSTVLAAMARSFLAAGTRVILVTPRPSPLRALSEEPGVAAAFEGTSLDSGEFRAALEKLAGPGVVLIDDAEVLRDCDAAGDLKEIISTGGEQQRALVFGGNSEDLCAGFTGWQIDAKRARRGCLLSPQQISDGDLIGTRLSRSLIGEQVRPGKALLNTGDGIITTVAVPVFTS